MAKFFGKIGFAQYSDGLPGVTQETIVERPYCGDVLRRSRKLQGGDGVNDNVVVSDEISILADPYAMENFHAIRCAEYLGTRWKISNVSLQYPRLILSLGGVYNGQ